MTETRLSVRVDQVIKKQAETVFNALGINMSVGINIYLTQVARLQAIPFSLELSDNILEKRMRDALTAKLSIMQAADLPVARYDAEKKLPYLEYSGSRKVYNID